MDETEGEDKQINPGKEEGHVFLTEKIMGKNNEGRSREASRWRRRQEESSCNVVYFFYFFPSINKKLSYFLSEDVELCLKA